MGLSDSIWADTPASPAPAARRPAAPPIPRPAVTLTAAPCTAVAETPSTARGSALAQRATDTTNTPSRAGSPAVTGPTLFNPGSDILAEAKALRDEFKGSGGAKGEYAARRGQGHSLSGHGGNRATPRPDVLPSARFGAPSPVPRSTAYISIPLQYPEPSAPAATHPVQAPQTKDSITQRGVAMFRAEERKQQEAAAARKPTLDVLGPLTMRAKATNGNIALAAPAIAPLTEPLQTEYTSLKRLQREESAQKDLDHEEEDYTSLLSGAKGVTAKEATKESLTARGDGSPMLPPHKRAKKTLSAVPTSAPEPSHEEPALVALEAATPAAAPSASWNEKNAAIIQSFLAKASADHESINTPATAQPIAATYETAGAIITATISPLDPMSAEHKAAAVQTERIIHECIKQAEKRREEESSEANSTSCKDEVMFRPKGKAMRLDDSKVSESSQATVQRAWSEKTEAEQGMVVDQSTRNGEDTWAIAKSASVASPSQASMQELTNLNENEVKEKLVSLMLLQRFMSTKRQKLAAELDQADASLVDIEKHMQILMDMLDKV